MEMMPASTPGGRMKQGLGKDMAYFLKGQHDQGKDSGVPKERMLVKTGNVGVYVLFGKLPDVGKAIAGFMEKMESAYIENESISGGITSEMWGFNHAAHHVYGKTLYMTLRIPVDKFVETRQFVMDNFGDVYEASTQSNDVTESYPTPPPPDLFSA
jgi:hypothetical protein